MEQVRSGFRIKLMIAKIMYGQSTGRRRYDIGCMLTHGQVPSSCPTPADSLVKRQLGNHCCMPEDGVRSNVSACQLYALLPLG